ncbi:MAG: endopeptidase La [Clostridia bacterium]|nr:endopeptidase La [Clostridia bacterium]
MEMYTIENASYPFVPMRGMVLFPGTVLHFDAGRARSIEALEEARRRNSIVFLSPQKNIDEEVPGMDGLFLVGTVAKIKQIVKLPGSHCRVIVEGLHRARLTGVLEGETFSEASVEIIHPVEVEKDAKVQALIKAAHDFFSDYAESSGKISSDRFESIMKMEEPGALADVIAANILTKMEERQEIHEILDDLQRLERVCAMMLTETEMAGVEREVQQRVREQVQDNQKEYFLREQIKAIQTELGDGDIATEVDDLTKKLEKIPMNDEARSRTKKQIDHLSHMSPYNPETSVVRTYVETLMELPWGKMTEDNLDLDRARKILAEDHCGLEDVKERVVEYLAVRKIKNDMKGPILCFVGPPGVGKTSVARSIARALGREFVQMSLGGVRDEAEIRGHRRTYLGAIPGRIISSIRQAGTMNPVFLFDEIDKMGMDVRGDPASAMLEVLDSEQNNAFRDHYLEAPFDLSHVMFITTANTADTIPQPLLDRMEMIEVNGYTEDEKLDIAKLHLLPDQIKEHGLAADSVHISDDIIRQLIQGYTREAGVRGLKRDIGKIVRKSAVEMLDNKTTEVTVDADKLRAFMGIPPFHYEKAGKKPEVGVVNGLAWTAAGGDTLQIEAQIMQGSGSLETTGSLGDVMKESAHAALTWVRAHKDELGITKNLGKESDIHIHVPEGAVPKDGPSAGVTMTTALVSALTGIPVHQNVAMTGEVTLRGRVLPIGGLKEKLLAAHRAGIDTVLIPRENEKDLEKMPEKVRSDIKIIPVEDVTEVLKVALTEMPKKATKKKDAAEKKAGSKKATDKVTVLPSGSMDVTPPPVA